MCGIIGIVSLGEDIAGDLVKGLKLLEYRGYDSAGLAVIKDGELTILKDRGTIDEIDSKLNFSSLKGSIGVGHTRWATHGAPDKINAHPHSDCTSSIAVVHNGIIENYLELKKELVEKGHVFKSRTDTEVIPHLVEEYLNNGLSIRDAFKEAIKRLKGAYAIALISTVDPTTIYCARKGSPLILGLDSGRGYCSSDIPSLITFTNRLLPMGEDEYALVKPNLIEVRRISDDSLVRRSLKEVSMNVEAAKREGYDHYMLKEIFEQPYTINYALEIQRNYLELMASFIDRASKLFLVAAGTSYHAGLVGSYLFSKLCRVTAIPSIASEFVFNYGDSVTVDDAVLAISQSGETRDVLWSVEYAKNKGATILAIVNVLASTLTRVARIYLHQQSGPEIGVAATKTYTGQLTVLYQLALSLARFRGKLSQEEMDVYREELSRMPTIVSDVLDSIPSEVKRIAKEIKDANYVIFLGRGVNTATAYEGRLKLMEISYIPSLAYPAGENKHGPISLIEKGTPVIAFIQGDDTKKLMISNVHEVRSRGAKTYVFTSHVDEEIKEVSDVLIELPKTLPIFTPIVYAIPLQLLAYYTSVMKGLNPDKPRNLAKSVTVL